jgi:outer membrane biosynthesis protein TonB
VPPPVAPALAVEPQPIRKEPAVTPNEKRSSEREAIAADSSTKLPAPLAPAADSAPGPSAVPEERTIRETPGVAGAAEPGYAPPIASAETAALRRPSIEIGLKGTQFGSYDSKIISAVQKRWYELLDERKRAPGDTGRVIVEFRLKYDGNISELNIARREVDFVPAWICQRAIADSAPFAPWPREMRHSITASFRSVRFTFVY